MDALTEFLNTPLGATLAFGAVSAWPLALIARRLGRTPLVAVLAFVPVLGLTLALAALLWGRWPTPPERPQ